MCHVDTTPNTPEQPSTSSKMSHDPAHIVTHSAITAFIALLPAEYFTYVEKLVSVLILAMVAELGRRVISALWDRKKK